MHWSKIFKRTKISRCDCICDNLSRTQITMLNMPLLWSLVEARSVLKDKDKDPQKTVYLSVTINHVVTIYFFKCAFSSKGTNRPLLLVNKQIWTGHVTSETRFRLPFSQTEELSHTLKMLRMDPAVVQGYPEGGEMYQYGNPKQAYFNPYTFNGG